MQWNLIDTESLNPLDPSSPEPLLNCLQDWLILGMCSFQGQYDSDLNEVGFQQADAVARRLAKGDFPFSAVYTSDLKRARLTGEAILAATGATHSVITKSELRERHLGVLQVR
jgi:broad specificity phosphatase PhoE